MMKDLIALTADGQQEKTLETLLCERRQALRIREVRFDIFRHPRSDPGVYREAHNFLRPYRQAYAYALVLLDRQWSGSPGNGDTLRVQIGQRLEQSGWSPDQYVVVVADPELEAWVWVESQVVAEELRLDWAAIRTLGKERGFWPADAPKPIRPKELLEAILIRQRRPRSAAIFQAIARRVSLEHCTDPSFILMREKFQHWFAL